MERHRYTCLRQISLLSPVQPLRGRISPGKWLYGLHSTKWFPGAHRRPVLSDNAVYRPQPRYPIPNVLFGDDPDTMAVKRGRGSRVWFKSTRTRVGASFCLAALLRLGGRLGVQVGHPDVRTGLRDQGDQFIAGDQRAEADRNQRQPRATKTVYQEMVSHWIACCGVEADGLNASCSFTISSEIDKLAIGGKTRLVRPSIFRGNSVPL